MQVYVTVLRRRLHLRQDQSSMSGVEDGIHLVGGVDLVLLARSLGCFMVNGLVDFAQERCGGCCEPPSSSELEGTEMAAPVSGAQQCVRVLLELLIGNGSFGGDLQRSVSKTANISSSTRPTLALTYRVIFSIYTQERYSNPDHRVHTLRIPVVCPLGRIPPRRTLYMSIEFVQVFALLNHFLLDTLVL